MNAACSGHRTSYITPPKRYNLVHRIAAELDGHAYGVGVLAVASVGRFPSSHGADHAGDQLAVSSSGSIPNLCVRSVRWKMMLNTPSHHRVHHGSNPRCSPGWRTTLCYVFGHPGWPHDALSEPRQENALVGDLPASR